jgi:hypothetical protein
VSGAQESSLSSPQQLSYTFGGRTHTRHMGHYFSDYAGSEINRTGIGSSASAYGDKYPLIQPFENYTNIGAASSAVTAASATSVQKTAPGFETGTICLAVALAAAILTYLRARRH